MNTDRRTLALGISTSLIFRIFGIVIGFISIPLLLSYFGAMRYGQCIAIQSVIAFSAVFSLGVPNAVIAIGSQVCTRENVSLLFRRILKPFAIYLICCLLIVLFFEDEIVGFVSQIIFKQEISKEIFTAIWFGCFIALVTIASTLLQNAFTAIHKIHITNYYQFAVGNIPFVSYLIVRLTKGGVTDYFRDILILNILVLLCLVFHYFKYEYRIVYQDISESRLSFRNIITTASSAMIMLLVSLVLGQFDTIIVSRFSLSSVLVSYNTINKLILLELSMAQTAIPAIFTIFAKWYAEQKWGKLNDGFSFLLNSMAVVIGTMVIGNAFFLKEVIVCWIGKESFAGFPFVLVLSFYIYFWGISASSYVVYSSFNIKRKLIIGLSFIEPLLKVVLTVILVNKFGSIGAACTTLIIVMVVSTWVNPLLLKRFSEGKIALKYKFVIKHFCLLILPMVLISTWAYIHLATLQKILIGIIMMMIYMVVSFFLLPELNKTQVKDLFSQFMMRIKGQINSVS